MEEHHHAGLSLVELMIALALGLIVMAAVVQLFITSGQSYRLHNAKAHIQENGRYALQLLTQQISNAAYHGCASRSGKPLHNTLSPPWDFTSGIHATNTTLRLFSAARPSLAIQSHNIAQRRFTVGRQHGFRAGQYVLISNCNSASIFQISKTQRDRLFYNADIQFPYQNGHISRLNLVQMGAQGNIRLNNRGNDLVAGIDELTLLFGIDNNDDGSVDSYHKANAVTDWQSVLSIQLSLLFVSHDKHPTLTNSHDGHLRDRFTTTIALRNRLP